MPAPNPIAQARARELFAEHKWSATQIADEVGVSARAVKKWRKVWKDEQVPEPIEATAPLSPADAVLKAQSGVEPPKQTAEALKATKKRQARAVITDPVAYWLAEVEHAEEWIAEAADRGHTGAGASWQKLKNDCRKLLDEAMRADAVRLGEEERRAVRDPEELARRIIRAIPWLARVCPEECAALARELERAVPSRGPTAGPAESALEE